MIGRFGNCRLPVHDLIRRYWGLKAAFQSTTIDVAAKPGSANTKRALLHAGGHRTDRTTLPKPGPVLGDAAMSAKVCLVGAGVVALVIGFSKPIEPLVELGLALIVMAWLTKPKA